MRIVTNGEAFAETALFALLVPMKKDDFEIKQFTDRDSGKTETKTAPDSSGRPQYKTQLQVMVVDDSGVPSRQEKNATVSLLEPADIQFGQTYNAKGKVWITHYTNDSGRMGVSIIAESVTPVALNTASPQKNSE